MCFFLKNGLNVFINRISGWHGNGIKMVSAYEGKTVIQFLMDLARNRLAEMEKKGILPKGKLLRRRIPVHLFSSKYVDLRIELTSGSSYSQE